MFKKRTISIILSIALVIGCVGIPSHTAQAASTPEEVTADTEAEVSVNATDSFGGMLAEQMDQETKKQEGNQGCNIFSVEMNGNQAVVSFETVKDAVLIVGIYEESGVKMLASGTSKVASGDTSVSITIETGQMPQYFYIRAFLVDGETYKPYCTAYESPNYTKEMQEFLAKTTKDFAGREILNLDEDSDNNFAVYNEDTIVITETNNANKVTKADEETHTYIIEQADASVTSLQKGDIFSYEYEDGTVLIVKAFSVRMDGTTAVITGADTSMEEVFDYVKIDTEETAENAVIDDSTCEEGITYNGLVDDNMSEEIQTQDIEIDNSKSKAVSLSIDKKYSENRKVTGEIKLQVRNSLKFYLSLSRQYLELKIDYSAKLSVSATGKIEKTFFSLNTFGFSPAAGVYVEITPSFVAEVSAKAELSGQLEGTIGFSVFSDTGFKNLTKNPSFKPELKGEITVFVGISMKPKVKIISERIAKAEVGATAGVEVTGSMSVSNEDTLTKKHHCMYCIDGDIFAKAEFSYEVKLLNLDKLTWERTNNISLKVADFYWSLDFEEFGFSTCPHIQYLMTVTVKDYKGNPVKYAKVDVTGTNEHHITDEKGTVSFYAAKGEHQIKVSESEENFVYKNIKIEDEGKHVAVKIKASQGNENTNEAGIKQISLYSDTYAVITENGDLWMWGYNRQGQLGIENNNYIDRGSPVKIMEEVKSISLGGGRTLALKEDGSLWGWGDNSDGGLGDGTTVRKGSPVKIMERVKEISLGYSHSAAIKEDGSLWIWGANSSGQLGDGTTAKKVTPVKIMENVKEISLDSSHSAAIKEDGSLWMWGENRHGELGDGTTEKKVTPVKIMENVKEISSDSSHSAAIKEDGSLWMWGENRHGQLGDGTTENKLTPAKIMEGVKEISLGSSHSAAIKEDGSLWMWGENRYGELGDGTTENKLTPVKIMENVKHSNVYSGYYYSHSAVIKEDGSLWMWGDNSDGQLGDGTMENRLTPVKIMEGVKEISLDSFHGMAIKEDRSLWMWGSIYVSAGSQVLLVERLLEPQNITNRLKVKQADNMQTASLESTDDGTSTFSGLIPNAVYNFYCMKSKEVEYPFSSDNLLYITQGTAKEDGSLKITYTPKQATANASEFVVCMSGIPIDSADIKIPNLTYTGKAQNLSPTITYQGKPLEEGVDYELSGDYSAIKAGPYKIFITGIGDYEGTITKTWQITDSLPFTDVHSGDWFENSVSYVYRNRIMTGLTPDTFGPAQNLSRAQFATILYRMSDSPEVGYSGKFPDVPDNQFYTKPVLWASKDDVKIVSGYADGYFGPNDNITREQMAVMMYRYASYKGYDTDARGDLSGFPDQSSVSAFSKEAMEWAVASGLISGNADQTLAPQGNASRAVCATIIMRFMENIVK